MPEKAQNVSSKPFRETIGPTKLHIHFFAGVKRRGGGRELKPLTSI